MTSARGGCSLGCNGSHREEVKWWQGEMMEATQDCTILWYKIGVGVRNDQMFKVTALKFKS